MKHVNMPNRRVFCPLDGAIFPCNPPGFLRKNCLPAAQNPSLPDTSPIFKQALICLSLRSQSHLDPFFPVPASFITPSSLFYLIHMKKPSLCWTFSTGCGPLCVWHRGPPFFRVTFSPDRRVLTDPEAFLPEGCVRQRGPAPPGGQSPAPAPPCGRGSRGRRSTWPPWGTS